jgi:tetratricopeptide (TPR) repeat protein
VGVRGNRGEIEQACGAYGFHPLSLRLLAGLVVNDFGNPGDMRVAQGLDVTGDLVQRQNHVLAQAYGSLAAGQRQLLSRMACFRSPVGFVVVEQTCGADEIVRQLQAMLRDLISRGLLHYDRSSQRFDLHPIVRRYAYDRMGSSERSSTHAQLRDYFAAVPAPERVKTVADLAAVIELYHHMVRAGQYDEAMDLFYDRINKATYYQLGAYPLRIELLLALFPQGEDHPPQLQEEGDQAWTLNSLANSYSLNGQPGRAVPLFEQHNVIREKAGDKKNLAIGLGNLAQSAQLPIGALRSVEANLRRSIALCQEIEDEFSEAIGHRELGRLLTYRGRWAEAVAELDKALELVEQQNNVHGQGIVWSHRALSTLLQVRAGEELSAATALAAAGRSLELADEFARTSYPVERDYVRSHWLLGSAHRVNGNLDLSDTHLNEALTRCRSINSVDAEADILIELARLRLDQNQPAEALHLATEAQEMARRCGYGLQEADAQLVLAALAQQRGERSIALHHAEEARRLATCDGGEFVYRVAWEEAGRMLGELAVQA